MKIYIHKVELTCSEAELLMQVIGDTVFQHPKRLDKIRKKIYDKLLYSCPIGEKNEM